MFTGYATAEFERSTIVHAITTTCTASARKNGVANELLTTIQRDALRLELELELIQTQLAQKLILRAEVYARALRASQNVKRAEVWVGA
jgi:hypothetical protein